MPVKLKIDWGLAYNLYMTGLTYREVAAKVGCKEASLRQHGARNNWTQELSQARQAVSQVVHNMVTREPLTIQKRAESWVNREIEAVERITDVLDVTPIPKDIKGIREHVEVRAMNGKYGRSTFGLDSVGTNVQINIGMSGQLAQIEPVQVQDQPIDVTPVEPEST